MRKLQENTVYRHFKGGHYFVYDMVANLNGKNDIHVFKSTQTGVLSVLPVDIDDDILKSKKSGYNYLGIAKNVTDGRYGGISIIYRDVISMELFARDVLEFLLDEVPEGKENPTGQDYRFDLFNIAEKKTKIFFDTEFTGLHKETNLLSIGLVSEDNKRFYAEITDYDKSQIDDWLEENVMSGMIMKDFTPREESDALFKGLKMKYKVDGSDTEVMKSTKEAVGRDLRKWLSQWDSVEMWSDCLAYDWVLFNDLFGNAFDIPDNVYYIPMDICTLFKLKGIDPDISREEFAGITDSTNKHNALYDAVVIKLCYEKLMNF